MGVIKTSKDQALLVTKSNKAKAKGKSNQKDPKAADPKPKQNQQTSEGASSSKKKKFENNIFPYCAKGFHHEDNCMKKQINQLSTLLKQHTIALPQEA